MAEKIYYLVSPELTGTILHLFSRSYTENNFVYNNYPPPAPPPPAPPPYVVIADWEAAHKQAQELSKRHHIPYYVASISVMGSYVPPPPEWQPIWQKSETVKL